MGDCGGGKRRELPSLPSSPVSLFPPPPPPPPHLSPPFCPLLCPSLLRLLCRIVKNIGSLGIRREYLLCILYSRDSLFSYSLTVKRLPNARATSLDGYCELWINRTTTSSTCSNFKKNTKLLYSIRVRVTAQGGIHKLYGDVPPKVPPFRVWFFNRPLINRSQIQRFSKISYKQGLKITHFYENMIGI